MLGDICVKGWVIGTVKNENTKQKNKKKKF